MANLSAKNIVKVYGNKPILDGISINLHERDKIALVGENGAGKTTLLRILAGEEESTEGNIVVDDYMPRVYMAQEFSGNPEETVASFFGNEKAQRSALRLFDELDISQKILEKKTGLLSGGQKKILQLVKVIASKSPYLFLDEPENHLDYFTREWLIATIRAYRGAVIFVSHDQYIINRVANKIIELEDGNLMTFPGDYQSYLQEKSKHLQGRYHRWQQMEREIERQRKMVLRMKDHAKINSDVAGIYRSRKKQLEKLIETREEKPRLERKKIKIRINDVDRKARKKILSLEDLTLKFGDNPIFERVNLQLVFGEKVCLFGRNGSGKTSLFKMVQGVLQPSSGAIKLGVNLKVGYFSQEYLEELDIRKTPLDEIRNIVGDEQRSRAILSNFLIDKTATSRSISTLSGGQKTRLRFAKLFSREIDFLLLDEPTNHIDTLSWQVLAEAIKSFNGTLLLISHDRIFVDEVVQKLWIINDGTIREFLGTLSEMLGEA